MLLDRAVSLNLKLHSKLGWERELTQLVPRNPQLCEQPLAFVYKVHDTSPWKVDTFKSVRSPVSRHSGIGGPLFASPDLVPQVPAGTIRFTWCTNVGASESLLIS